MANARTVNGRAANGRAANSRTVWQNRIAGHGEEAPEQLLANPRNWRVHPKHQQEALAGVLREVGWVQEVIVNRRTGFVVDGHLRVALAISERQPAIPVKYVDLTEEEEALVLATLDPIGALAVADKAQLDALLRDVRSGEAAVQQLLTDLAEREGLLPEEEDAQGKDALREVADELEGAFTLKADMRFASSEPYNIPPLRADRLLALPETLELWPGDDLRAQTSGGPYLLIWSCSCQALDFTRTILAFYTEDVRFESAWAAPERWAARLLNAGILGVVAPNFSLWPDQAQAVHIWQVYRSRWLARYFQEAGLAVLPDVNWAGPDDYEFCFAGIPTGAPCLSMQIQTFDPRRPDEVQRVREGILTALDRLRPERALFYASKAGRALLSELQLPVPAVVVPTLMDHRREKLRRKEN